jgi:hypothetical protein
MGMALLGVGALQRINASEEIVSFVGVHGCDVD